MSMAITISNRTVRLACLDVVGMGIKGAGTRKDDV
jgi:hypothetical protein